MDRTSERNGQEHCPVFALSVGQAWSREPVTRSIIGIRSPRFMASRFISVQVQETDSTIFPAVAICGVEAKNESALPLILPS